MLSNDSVVEKKIMDFGIALLSQATQRDPTQGSLDWHNDITWLRRS